MEKEEKKPKSQKAKKRKHTAIFGRSGQFWAVLGISGHTNPGGILQAALSHTRVGVPHLVCGSCTERGRLVRRLGLGLGLFLFLFLVSVCECE